MAVVTQALTPRNNYSPFEGMSEAQRLVTAVPRGLVRFDSNSAGLTAKPVNDSYDLTITCQLPNGFAYVISAVSFDIAVDTASDFDNFCTISIFNGISNGQISNQQRGSFGMSLNPQTVAADPRRVMHYQLGGLHDSWPGPIVRTQAAVAHSMLLTYHNSAAAVQAAGAISFHASFYQYELNQAVRFPMNFPMPVGVR